MARSAGAKQLDPHMLVYEDAGGMKTISEIAAFPDFEFRRSPDEAPSFGFTESVYWVKLTLTNTGRANNYFIEVDNPLINRIDLYYRDGKTGSFTRSPAGNGRKAVLREVQHHNHVFDINFKAGETRDIYLKLQSRDHMTFPMLLWDASSFVNNKIMLYLFFGLFYGIMIAMIIYNGFLSISLRNMGYLYYTLSILAFTFFFLSFNGFGFLYLWGDFPYFAIRATPLFVAMVIIFVPMFTKHYLETEKYSKAFSTLLHVFTCLGILCLVSMFVLDLMIATQVTVGLAIVICFTVLVITFFYRRHNRRTSNYFILAWSVLLVSAIITALRSFAILPDTFFVRYATQFGLVFEVLVLSLGLADKIKILEDEKSDARQEAATNRERLIATLQESEIELEHKVSERTASLAEANRQLNEANAAKDKFFSIIAHDLKNPLTGMLLSSELLIEFIDRADKEKVKARAVSLYDSGKKLYELLSNLLEWSREQMNKTGLVIKEADIEETVGSVVALVKEMAEAKNIQIKISTEGSAVWCFDVNMIQTVIRNLVTNAIKFTNKNGMITIDIRNGKDKLTIAVKDNGVGISEENLSRLFRIDQHYTTSGTSDEKGTGLGLLLCKEFIAKHGGDIRVESRPGEGSSFIFSLPELAAV